MATSEKTVLKQLVNERGQTGRAEFGDPDKTDKFYPHLTLVSPWGGERGSEEEQIKIELLNGLGAIQSEVITANDLKIIGADATSFQYIKNNGREVEWEIILPAKPKQKGGTIWYEFGVTSSSRLKWNPQPHLTLPVDNGDGTVTGLLGGKTVTCREDCQGSFTVYSKIRHDIKQDGVMTRRGAGKIFQLWRPQVFDRDSVSLWGDIELVTGGFRIGFDAAWFQLNTPPFTIDPNYGYDTLGASVFSSNSSLNIGVTAIGSASNVNAIFIGTNHDSTDLNIKGLVYSSDGSDPQNAVSVLVVSEVGVMAENGPAEWVDMTVTSPVELADGDYFIGWVSDGGSPVQVYDADNDFDGLYDCGINYGTPAGQSGSDDLNFAYSAYFVIDIPSAGGGLTGALTLLGVG